MKPDTISVSLVLVGQFAPSKYVLAELARNGTLSSSDVAASAYEMLLKDQGVEIKLPWGKLLVINDRLNIEAVQAPFVRACDLILKCLTEIDVAARVSKLGINVKATYLLGVDARDAMGKRLVPASQWGSWGRQVAESQNLPADDLRHGGMASAVLREQRRGEKFNGWIDARVDAGYGDKSKWGVTLSVNDHYELATSEKTSDRVQTAELLEVMASSFDDSLERSLKIIDGIVTGK